MSGPQGGSNQISGQGNPGQMNGQVPQGNQGHVNKQDAPEMNGQNDQVNQAQSSQDSQQMNGQGISPGITTTASPDTTTSSINVIYQIFHSSELLTDKTRSPFNSLPRSKKSSISIPEARKLYNNLGSKNICILIILYRVYP
jgi:hypothetical protein